METHGRVQRRQSRVLCTLVGAQHKDKRQQTQVAGCKVSIRDLLDFWRTSTCIWTLSHRFGSACFKSPAASSILLAPERKVTPRRSGLLKTVTCQRHNQPFPAQETLCPLRVHPTHRGNRLCSPRLATPDRGQVASALARTVGPPPAPTVRTGHHLTPEPASGTARCDRDTGPARERKGQATPLSSQYPGCCKGCSRLRRPENGKDTTRTRKGRWLTGTPLPPFCKRRAGGAVEAWAPPRDQDLPPRQAEGLLPSPALPVGAEEGPRPLRAVLLWGRSTRNTKQRKRNGARPPPSRTAVRTGGGTERGIRLCIRGRVYFLPPYGCRQDPASLRGLGRDGAAAGRGTYLDAWATGSGRAPWGWAADAVPLSGVGMKGGGALLGCGAGRGGGDEVGCRCRGAGARLFSWFVRRLLMDSPITALFEWCLFSPYSDKDFVMSSGKTEELVPYVLQVCGKSRCKMCWTLS